MNIFDRTKNALRAFTTNSVSIPNGRQFLKYGNKKPIIQDWSQTIIEDSEMYKGYSYAAIRKRSGALAQLATGNIKTTASTAITEQAKDGNGKIIHPYLELINSSTSFSNNFFSKWVIYLYFKGIFWFFHS